jgi:hypothetical protein
MHPTIARACFAVPLAVTLTAVLAAQQTAPPEPPKVLNIVVEYLKPGVSLSQHAVTEKAFSNTSKLTQQQTHYIGMDSLTGQPRALFFSGYDSFEAWGKDQNITTNGLLGSAFDADAIADGQNLSGMTTNVFAYHPEMSVHAAQDIPHARFFEISRFTVRAGHEGEWNDLAKIYTDYYSNQPSAHWATYESVYGMDNGGVYLVITPMKSLAEVDQSRAMGEQMMKSLGPEGMKKAGALAAACIEASMTNVFAIDPRMSYASDDWSKSDPDFWGQH